MSLLTHISGGRQSGKTTRAMQDAPYGAFYVWPNNNSIDYARKLAAKLGRTDLNIVPASWMAPQFLASPNAPIAIDHATNLEPEQDAFVSTMNAKAGARNDDLSRYREYVRRFKLTTAGTDEVAMGFTDWKQMPVASQLGILKQLQDVLDNKNAAPVYVAVDPAADIPATTPELEF